MMDVLLELQAKQEATIYLIIVIEAVLLVGSGFIVGRMFEYYKNKK